MDRKTAQNLIEATFNNAFNEKQFITFVRNLLNNYENKYKHYIGITIWDDYKEHINSYKRIGKYIDPEGETLDILIVEVKSVQKLERARTTLRNFVIKHIGKFEKDYALVAFYSKEDGGADWRFSFVKLEYSAELDEEKDKVKIKKKFTPAKRYSFLVGKYEKSYTAKNQLLPLLQNITNNPSIEELEAAFSIEKVTDEFFHQYKDLYIKLYEHFENDIKVRTKLKNAGIENTRFTKKLLGQIVFLYFLQKKGWLGVAQNERWGTGNKRFVQKLYDQAQNEGVNFFKDKLQYLFYEALAKERDNENSYYKRFDCRIPFLNGGLFEAEYDWHNTNITIPDNLFRNNEKNKAGDIGTGVLDVFDRYNFTIKEDEPLDKEVAVDPEMLGKVFENMLDITERKSKGAFYTPREIVHYMCQESLIHYLDNALNSGSGSYQELGSDQIKLFSDSKTKKGQAKIEIEHNANITVPKKDIEIFIRGGHFVLENDERVAAKGKTRTYQYQLPESIRDNADLIDKKLCNIKICDPAIGSGAFPVGLLHELVNAMLVLKTHLSYDYLTKKLKALGFEHRESVNDSRYIYRLKRHIIQESIYGVDIDASAIDIARLRLWLSLVVDEDDLDPIETLPNLDYKIVVGNSLIGLPGNAMRDLEVEAQLEKLKEKFYNITNEKEKKELRQQINDKIRELLDSAEQFVSYKIDFDFKLFFSEVWREKGGFDIVIGNPPYVEAKKLKHISSLLKGYEVYSGTADLSVYFIEKGILLSKQNGLLALITTNKFFNTGYGKLVRNFIQKKNITHLINFEQVEVFEKVLVSSVIIGLENKSQKSEFFIFKEFKGLKFLEFRRQFENNKKEFSHYSQKLLGDTEWTFSDPIELLLKNKIEKEGTKILVLDGVQFFRGVTTGYNPAFIIGSEKKKELISADCKNVKIIKPLLQGRNIRKWRYENSDTFLLQTEYDLDILKEYPDVFNYLSLFYDELYIRSDQGKNWWNLRACQYYPEFEKPEKIIWGLTADKWAFAYDDKQHYLPSNGYILTSETIPIKYILGILNSSVLHYYFGFIGVMTAGGAYTLKHATIQQLPLILSDNSKVVIILVDYILNLKNTESNVIYYSFFEALIDAIVFELYFPDEIKSAGKEILKHLQDLQPITDKMSEEKKLATIQSEYDRLSAPNHPVRLALDTLDNVEEVRIIKEALK
ncbi:MAG TPA: TaqI-like C-terminal specificity domain-containing protein [Bacteroidales bacterium]|nr:TaqI-like C-terminal specificity domain-containing protein [Bacteroidales bacterium]